MNGKIMTIPDMFKRSEELYSEGKMEDNHPDSEANFRIATDLLLTANVCVRLEILANAMGDMVKLQTELIELLKVGTLVYPTPTV